MHCPQCLQTDLGFGLQQLAIGRNIPYIHMEITKIHFIYSWFFFLSNKKLTLWKINQHTKRTLPNTIRTRDWLGGIHDTSSPEHRRKGNLPLRNKNSFFEKSVLWQFDSLTLISSIPTLLSIWKFPPSSLNKDQRNSWGEWKDGLRGDEYKLKLDGSWVKAGKDLTPQQTPWKPLTLSTAPKVGDGTRVSLPVGYPKSALTVSSWCLMAARQCPPRALEADLPCQEA